MIHAGIVHIVVLIWRKPPRNIEGVYLVRTLLRTVLGKSEPDDQLRDRAGQSERTHAGSLECL